MSIDPRLRRGARAVVIDREHRVLLVHFDFVDAEKPTGFWACPGGGVDPGESLHDAVVRELAEETGLVISDPGAPIWWKEHRFPMASWDGQHDTFFFVEVDHFEPAPRLGHEQLRREHVDALRWWSRADLLRAQEAFDHGDAADPHWAAFSPRRLGHLVGDLIDHGRPMETIEVSSP